MIKQLIILSTILFISGCYGGYNVANIQKNTEYFKDKLTNDKVIIYNGNKKLNYGKNVAIIQKTLFKEKAMESVKKYFYNRLNRSDSLYSGACNIFHEASFDEDSNYLRVRIKHYYCFYDIVTPFSFDINTKIEDDKIILYPPISITTESEKNLDKNLLYNLSYVKKVVADFFNTGNYTILTSEATIIGEINANYNEKSVFSNYLRKLDSYTDTIPPNGRLIKDKTFWYQTKKGFKFPVVIEVYPYRNGSKIKYYAEFIPIADGNNIIPTKEDIEQFKKDMIKIAND